MELARNTAIGKSTEPRNFAPSIVRPLELSGRLDSSRVAFQGDRPRAPAEGSSSASQALAGDLVVIDQKRIEEAAAWISAKVAATIKRGAQDVGEYVLDTFFGGDPQLVQSKNPHKNASFRALVGKCGSSELPVSKTWLNNAVGVATMLRRLPETARAFKQLPPSHQEKLLSLRDPTAVERVARQAVVEEMSYRELREVVATERAKKSKADSRGRPPATVILKTLTRSLRVLTLEVGRRSFTKADFEELGKEQRKDALGSAEALIEKLGDLVIRLKRAEQRPSPDTSP